jgi:lipoprotein signal peptidase
MNKTKIVKFVLGVIFLGISVNFFKDYIAFKSAISESKPIVYSFIERRINKGGRGETYEMDYQYKYQKGTVNITSQEYDLIANAKYPSLYYSKNTGLIFSKWEEKKAFRITILFLVLFIVAIFPWNKLYKLKASN